MQKRTMLYEGKAKRLYETDDKDLYIVSYKDDATAFNGKKRGSILGKGAVNNKVTNHMMQLLEGEGIPTHFVTQLSDTDTLVKAVTIIPLEVIVRNIAAGSLSSRLGLEEGVHLATPVLEFCYKRDDLDDPMVNMYHIKALSLATDEQVQQITSYALRINEILCSYLRDLGITLVDFKLEFGMTSSGQLLLSDEISPDTCRFWDTKTNKKLDKDRFRRDLGDVEAAYQELLSRLMGDA
ncbi:phosphoribosylaminoimidazolesuccinocarboxamide synthase [Sphaerochaeta halotolerans]|uniref:phosphoribosylaminoimidazolesuccinocarboxamide synthase n=1 Tax=Sphaerochaeta halotolerans TaxID=2293840 RepID=UPI001368E3FC|nr:phosphoribosylaminoimidazolesuccinocarboxamide synthase [Sphaerochaeta halotolerans]MBG0767167.1 phosphoribosylaminoimidazolesuccinocarboxamide synthase [Spirochaetaceae bacterium]MDK2859286.1 phosphoribosylaminoimidazole-succinocarboxamide synthase [Sphaerochaeta sp.]MXI85348.1 phosphoribosylaminoimidazolesuccinocarboxamide synthase [Sphaerochaeta halotolerans]